MMINMRFQKAVIFTVMNLQDPWKQGISWPTEKHTTPLEDPLPWN
jgi:hypothetical protein